MSTEKIVEIIANIDYKDIPEEAVSVAKMCILDGFGVALAGTRTSTGTIITKYVKDTGCKPVSGVIGSGFKTSAELAALANGTLAHALDYDDHTLWMAHPTAVLLPPLFSLAERDNFSGQQILEAYIIGWELGSKLCSKLAISLFEQGWHPTSTIGTLAATAACAKLLKLEPKQIKIALGIAASEAAGLRYNLGTDTKPLHAGKAASNAITAALLAKNGFNANDAILEGPLGFCQVFAKKDCDPSAFTQTKNSSLDIVTSYAIKPYPSCGLTHRSIDAMLQLVKEYQFKPDEIAKVECHVPALVREILFYSNPQNGLQGKFSMEYCMAAAIIDRKAGLRQFTDEKVQSSAAQEFIPKVSLVYLKGIDPKSVVNDIPQAVKVKLRNGTEYFREVEWPKGYSYNPMNWEEVANKFRDCADTILSIEEMDRGIDLLSRLDSLASVSKLMGIVSKTPS
jgi:2-methylcitrate dehydratase PrpD